MSYSPAYVRYYIKNLKNLNYKDSLVYKNMSHSDKTEMDKIAKKVRKEKADEAINNLFGDKERNEDAQSIQWDRDKLTRRLITLNRNITEWVNGTIDSNGYKDTPARRSRLIKEAIQWYNDYQHEEEISDEDLFLMNRYKKSLGYEGGYETSYFYNAVSEKDWDTAGDHFLPDIKEFNTQILHEQEKDIKSLGDKLGLKFAYTEDQNDHSKSYYQLYDKDDNFVKFYVDNEGSIDIDNCGVSTEINNEIYKHLLNKGIV